VVGWVKTFGISSSSDDYSVQQTTDGGYIVGGWTYLGDNKGIDFWLIKLKEKLVGKRDINEEGEIDISDVILILRK